MSTVTVECSGITKVYNGAVRSVVLDGISLEIRRGEFYTIMGPSGSGKSTLLYILAGLTRPTEAGSLSLLGTSLLGRKESWLAKFRANHVGFVLQFFGLIPTLSAKDNVALAAYFGGKEDRDHLAIEYLTKVGMEEHASKYPHQLSGGQKQRVAIARALVNSPDVLFADEPTGNLDSKSSEQVMELIRTLNKELGLTVLLVTHERAVASYSDETLYIQDGRLLG